MELFNVLLENCKAASCFFLFLMLIRPLTEKFFSQSWHYLALRVNLLLFFLPVPWLSDGIAPFMANLFPRTTTSEVIQQSLLEPNFTITWGEQIVGEHQQFIQVNSIDWTGLLVSTWIAVAVGLILWQSYCYVRLHREAKSLSAIQSSEIQKLFEKCKVLMGFTGAIPLLESETIYSPVLLGLYHPKILLPVKKVQEKHLEYIFIHELTHLRRKDLWWKALLIPLTILYWWNPLIYLFSWDFDTVLEYSCDEEVIKLRSHEERKCYGKAILESIDEEKTNPVFGVSFRKPEQLLEKRLIKMLKFSEMKTRTKVLSGVLMCAMLLGAAAPTVASAVSKANSLGDSGEALSVTPTIVTQGAIHMDEMGVGEDLGDIFGKNLDVQSFDIKITAVSPEDEGKFTPEEWTGILEKVETGEIQMIEEDS